MILNRKYVLQNLFRIEMIIIGLDLECFIRVIKTYLNLSKDLINFSSFKMPA